MQPTHDVAFGLLVLEGRESILYIMARVGGKSLGDDEQRIGERVDAVLGLALDGLLEVRAPEVGRARDLERTSTGDDGRIDDGVVHAPEAITDSVLDLGDRVGVGSLDENRGGLGVLDILLGGS